MLTVAHVGVGGVKNGRKHAHVINGRPHTQLYLEMVYLGLECICPNVCIYYYTVL